ncbi:MAG: glycosyltransferase [Clostridia bacterium]|nr:glycosyltransferase [Clostridia bacterium]
MKISLIIPMYNESKIIEATARELSRYMSENFDDYEILFSDDGSKDGCGRIVEDMELPCVRVVGYAENRGKGCAVRHAMLEADGDIRLFTDADLAYGTDVIKSAYDMMSENAEADMLIGSRNLGNDGYEGYTLLRKLMSKAYIKVLCITGGFRLSDSQCGFKAFRAETAEEIFSKCKVDGFAFDFEAILRATKLKKTICEMPVKIINHRESSIRPFSDTLKMLGDLRKIKKDVKKDR